MGVSNDWLTPDWAAPPSVRVVCTTRRGGISLPPWDSMNPADHVGDDPAAVTANRAALGEALSLPSEPCWLQQVHGTQVVEAGPETGVAKADAAWTRQTGTVCVVQTADCLPVVLCNERGTRVAVAHAGWRGLEAGVIEATARAAGLEGGGVLAWLGPAIGPAAFVVGDEVRQAFLASDSGAGEAFSAAGGGRWHADLYRLARRRLARCGITRVSGGGLCSFTDAERFFSYRREGTTGRMATLAWLEDAQPAPGRV
jgi:YfiH family protein